MKKFKHIVFTRQALYWGRVPMDNDVINYKLDLFEKTLLKSIQRQTDQNFTFVQLVSVQVDQAIKDRIKEYGEIVWVTEIGEHGPDAEALRRYIAKTVSDVDIIITTNVDNDDMPYLGYVEEINNLCPDSIDLPLLVCPKYEYHISKLGLISSGEISDTSVSPMLTVLEEPHSSSRIRTARLVNHDHMLPHFKSFKQIAGPALYTVSEANIWRDYGKIGEPEPFKDFQELNQFGLNKLEILDLISYLSPNRPQFIGRRKMYRGERA